MQEKKPTLQDVAEMVGVSTATISRCLSLPHKVKPAVREQIMAAIHTLGYVPHGAARALASRRTRTIGAIVPTVDNAIFAKAIESLQHELTQAGYTLLLANSRYSLEEELRETQTLLSRGVDGLVLVGEEHLPETLEAIRRQEIPTVNLWIYNEHSEHSCIGFDHMKAGRQLASHLVDLSHREYGVISGLLENNDRAAQRLDGMRGFLKEQNIDLADDRVFECRYSVEQGRQALHQLMTQQPAVTAVLCGNDILALGALWGAREMGISVPDQLSVTGFDNLDFALALSPQLTTVNAPSRRMGEQAAVYLLKQIENKDAGIQHIELEAQLIVRESTAVARSSGLLINSLKRTNP